MPLLYLALYTQGPDGTEIEVTGGGYQRVELPPFKVEGRSFINSARIQFPEATGYWGDVTNFNIFDSYGRIILGAPLNHFIRVSPGITVSFEPGSLVISIPNLILGEGTLNPEEFFSSPPPKPSRTLWERLDEE